MPDSLTVLFTSAGRRVELIACFRADAAELGIKLRLLAADLKPDRCAAGRVADARFALPMINDPGYIDAVLTLCEREQVGLVVPLQEPELPLMAASRKRFAAIGTKVTISAPKMIAVAQDKLATARAFTAAGIPTPRTARLDDVLSAKSTADWHWPVIAKPSSGGASIGVHLVPDRQTLGALALRVDRARYIVQECCAGREYTVNVFVDRAGSVRCAVPHERLEVRAGEVSKGRTQRQDALGAIARKLEQALPGAWGPLCFQAFVAGDGSVGVFEINARFGGGYPLAHHAGATFPRWLMEDALGREITARDEWRSGVLMLRHDRSIFVEE